MKIHYLWHSEFIVEMKNNLWKTVKIMSDAWLSDYAFWDMMARNPKIKIDYSKFDIDAIFISHSHCDHLDPYTLVDIYKNIHPRPVLLIPETIEFLVPLFEKYLPKQKIIILKNNQNIDFNGINITWIVFENNYITNEDDVMTLAIYNDDELVYTDVDTHPPENEESINLLYDIFTKRNFIQAVYLSTRNELAWNFKVLEANSPKARKEIEREYLEQRKEEIEYNYYRFEEDFFECSDIQELPFFMKAVIWQWIVHPNPEFLKIRVLPLKQEAMLEKQASQRYKKNFPITHFEAGKTYLIENRKFEILQDVYLAKEIDFKNPKIDLETPIFKEDKIWPIDNFKRNFKAQEQKILQMLNQKFLPYRLANSEDNLKNAILQSKNRKYVVKIFYWSLEDNFQRNYYFDFSSTCFLEEKSEHNWHNEEYWANDLEDFLEWRQELYSNFWHKLDPKKAYRVWTCLWANFLNNDILLKKFEFHFKRASIWKDVNSFVEPILKNRM